MPIATPKPTADWTCRELLDANAVHPGSDTRCAFCNTRIRWVHLLEHDEYPRQLEAGCCCASRLCFDYDAAGAERDFKNKIDRLARFIDAKRWKRSKTNPSNIWRWVQVAPGEKARVTIFFNEGNYGIVFVNKSDSSDRYFWPYRYQSQPEAKSVAFDVLDRKLEER